MTESLPPDDWLTVAECAARLNKPVRTVRHWAKRLPQEAKRVRPGLPLAIHFASLVDLTLGKIGKEEAEQVEDGKPDLADFVQHLQAENDKLWRQIETQNVAEAELRRLMLADKQEIARLREQIAPPAEVGPQPDKETPTARPWWAWWRRG